MSKSHARQRQQNKGRQSNQLFITGFTAWIVGLAMGIIVTFLILAKNPSSISHNQANHTRKPNASAQTMAKPTFDFYTILPSMEVVIPQEEPKKTVKAKPAQRNAHEQINEEGSYVLQIASFKHYADADQLKAKLALLGFEVNIEKVTLNDNEVWHRVRLGPYKGQQLAQQEKQKLGESNISSLLLKLKNS